MNLDCIREIAFHCNFKTVRNLLKIYPSLNHPNFWREKCAFNFPNDNYLDFYTGEENYLLREKKEFVLAVDYCEGDYSCHNVLYEYNRVMQEMLNLSDSKLFERCIQHQLVPINIEARFVILKYDSDDLEFSLLYQCDSQSEAVDIMKDYDENDGIEEYDYYMIIDLRTVVPHFLKYGRFRQSIEIKYKVYNWDDLKYL